MGRLLPIVLLVSASCVNAVAETGISEARKQELENFVVQDCGSCHGLTFKGGLGSAFSKKKLNAIPTEALYTIIDKGIEGTPMPAWGPLLSSEEIYWIIAYLRRVSPDE